MRPWESLRRRPGGGRGQARRGEGGDQGRRAGRDGGGDQRAGERDVAVGSGIAKALISAAVLGSFGYAHLPSCAGKEEWRGAGRG